MPVITIEEATFERLQRNAKPLVDTTDMVVNRALDALEYGEDLVSSAGGRRSPVERQIDPKALPNLTHTKVLDASLNGERITKPNWNLLLERVLVYAMALLADFDELRSLCPANIVQGRKEDEGYRHLANINVSFQGMSANDACAALVIAAQNLRVEVEVVFVWRTRKGAAHPGEKARLHLPGTPSGVGER